MSATAINKKPVNAFSGMIINIYPKLESIYVHKSLDTIDHLSIIENFPLDNLFL